jgi:formate-dependent nitrite reductase membrane component NrfD
MRDTITQQGRLDFSVAPRMQTIWGFREAAVFFLEGLGVSIFMAFMLLNDVLAMLVGIILVIAAVLLLLSHLGHPFRAWMAIRNVRRSWVSRGTAVISGFIGLGVAYIGFALIFGFAVSGWWGTSIRSVLALAALFILLYPGFAMATSAAIPFWNSGLLPVLSMLNGIASGGLVLLAYLAGTEQARLTIGWVDLVWVQQSVLCLLAVITLVYMVTMSNAGAAAGLSAGYLMTREPMLFWGLAIGAGLVLPIVAIAMMLTFHIVPASLLWVAVVARLAGDVSVRHAFLKAGIYDAALQPTRRA